jgi:hypothetical protein
LRTIDHLLRFQGMRLVVGADRMESRSADRSMGLRGFGTQCRC